MNKAAILHIPASEMAYYENKDELHLQLQSAHNDLADVTVLVGEVSGNNNDSWRYESFFMQKTFATRYHDYWEVTLKLNKNEAQYVFKVTDTYGNVGLYDAQRLCEATEENANSPHGFIIENRDMRQVTQIPDWVTKTVWYQIQIDRFANGNDNLAKLSENEDNTNQILGGDLTGILSKLDYLQNLGINGIVLSSIFEGDGPFKLTTNDFYSIDSQFGNKDLFKMLVSNLHRRNMKVVLKMNLAYLSDNSRQWREILEEGQHAKYVDWFNIKGFLPKYSQDPHNKNIVRANYKFSELNPHYPTLNLKNPEVQTYLIQAIKYWVEHFEIDGLILDHADKLSRECVHLLNRNLKKMKPDFYLVGKSELSTTSVVQLGDFDAMTDDALGNLLLNFARDKKIAASEFKYQLSRQMLAQNTKLSRVTLRTLDDLTSSRILTRCRENKALMRSLLTFMYLLKGSPAITYGTELGLSGHDFPSNLVGMDWNQEDQDDKMMRFIKVLNNFRLQNYKILSEGSFEWGQISDSYDYVSFIRRKDKRRLFALFNFGYNGIKFVLPKHAKLILGQNIVDEKSEIGQYGFVILEA